MSFAPPHPTLPHALRHHAATAARGGLTFIEAADRFDRLSVGDVLERALRRAAVFARMGVRRGEPVLLILPTSADYALTFLGAMLAGGAPCSLAAPGAFGGVTDFAHNTSRVAKYLGVRRVITEARYREAIAALLPTVAVLTADDLREGAETATPDEAPALELGGDDRALIQCTSGSTGQPKGVVISHGALAANVHQIGLGLGARDDDVIATWLPLYHDMGLIGCLLFGLYRDLPAFLMPPGGFLRRPATWLQVISGCRGTLSPAPNFAYGYVAARAREEELAGVDLSSWRVALCGAEPINPGVLAAFQERFAAWGLAPDVVMPCYGLAEATLAVTFHPHGTPLRVDRVAREALVERGVVEAAADGAPDAMTVVDCGAPLADVRVRIVDAQGADLPEGRVGRVHVASPSLMDGYLSLRDETAAVLADGWLDTGDQGYLREGSLRITGRDKDIIIVRGRNYLPSDFEWAAEEVEGVRKGGVVAFGIYDEESGTEGVCLLCETDVTGEGPRRDLLAALRTRVAERTGIAPTTVELIPRGTIQKTSSGKVQRSKMKELYLAARGGVAPDEGED